jgi:hypothetical protein
MQDNTILRGIVITCFTNDGDIKELVSRLGVETKKFLEEKQGALASPYIVMLKDMKDEMKEEE